MCTVKFESKGPVAYLEGRLDLTLDKIVGHFVRNSAIPIQCNTREEKMFFLLKALSKEFPSKTHQAYLELEVSFESLFSK